jgi:hypothetical protein
VRLSKANASTLYALVEQQGVLNTTVTLTGSAQIALARNPRRAIARGDQTQPDGTQPYGQQYSDAGEPVVLTPQPQLLPGRQAVPQERLDDGYIYPADGSSDGARYPAPRGTTRRLYGAQAYPQPQYNPGYYAPAPQGYYQQRQYYQQRGFYQD